jgi:hypothetical protein
MQQPDRPSEPWFSFLSELDTAMGEPVDLHCMGGFVVSQHYGFPRETSDLDVLALIPNHMVARVSELAGRESALAKKHRVYIDHVGVVNYPAEYDSRLIRAFPLWPYVHLWALEPHDLALTKLERSKDRDIRDVIFLAQAGLSHRDQLVSRFEDELEPYISGRTPTWNRTTLEMPIDACWPG